MTQQQIETAATNLREAMDAVKEVADKTRYPRLADNLELIEPFVETIQSALADLAEGEVV